MSKLSLKIKKINKQLEFHVQLFLTGENFAPMPLSTLEVSGDGFICHSW